MGATEVEPCARADLVPVRVGEERVEGVVAVSLLSAGVAGRDLGTGSEIDSLLGICSMEFSRLRSILYANTKRIRVTSFSSRACIDTALRISVKCFLLDFLIFMMASLRRFSMARTASSSSATSVLTFSTR